MVKFNEVLHDSAYCPDPVPSDYWLFVDLKRMLQSKRFGLNEETIAEVETSLENILQKRYRKLEESRSVSITLEGILMKKGKFCLKLVVLLIRPETY